MRPGGSANGNATQLHHQQNPSSEDWLGELDRSLDWTDPSEPTPNLNVAIYTVPRHLRAIFPGDFEPVEFRFGLHNRSLRHYGIDKMKIDVAREFMKLNTLGLKQWKQFTRQVVKDSNRARQVYEEPEVPLGFSSEVPLRSCSEVRFLGLGSDEVVRNILTLDALFLVVFLQAGLNKYRFEGFKNAIIRRGLLHHSGNFYKDAVLLENQVPMYLLREVMLALYPAQSPHPSSQGIASPRDASQRDGDNESGSSRTRNTATENGSNSFSVSSNFTSSSHLGNSMPRTGNYSAEEQLEEVLQLAVSLVYPFIAPSPHDKTGGEYVEEQLAESFHPAPYLRLYGASEKNVLQQCEHLLDCVYRVVSHTLPSKCKDHAISPARKDPIQRVFSKTAIPLLQRSPQIRVMGITRIKANLVSTLSDTDREPVRRVFSKLSNLPRAIMLRRSGIRIKPTPHPVLRDVRFDPETAILYLPRVEFFDYTAAMFRNLVIYEQLAVPDSAEFMSYLQFLDYLIDTAEDVAYLSKCDVLKNNVGSDQDVADMVNQIRIGLASTELSGKWRDMHKHIIAHCNDKWHVYKAEFCGTYFSRPWYIASFIIGCILVLTSITQTVIAFIALP